LHKKLSSLPAHRRVLAKAFRYGGYRLVQDIVDAVMSLESAGFATGDILHVDGGQNAGDRLN
jgi:hypothetical protein